MLKNLTKEEKSWILYDWSSQGYVMIVHSVIFSLFFLQSASTAFGGGSDAMVQANAYWSLANTVGTVIVGLLAPVLGTLSGYKGKKKLIFTFFACMGIIGTIALAIVPEQLWWLLLLIFLVASIGFSGSNKIDLYISLDGFSQWRKNSDYRILLRFLVGCTIKFGSVE